MKHGIAVFLIVCFAAVMVYGVNYLSTHDTVVEVLDVNNIKLNKGRIVNLIGIAPTRTYEMKAADDVEGATKEDSVRVIAGYDTASVQRVKDMMVEGRKVRLVFTSD